MTTFGTIVVAVTVAAHFAFVGYGVIGGFLALRWPRTMWLHVAVVAWCAAMELVDFVCPLTALERWARAGAGMPPLPSNGFIDYYITGVWYPARYEDVVLGLVLVVVLTSWVLVVRGQLDGMSRSCSKNPPKRRSRSTAWTSRIQ